ncbi:MAG: aminotransferase class I/II-fold pyridoxal phosphate-dependent enzyme [Gemmatimonadota bacterium]
MEKSSTPPLRFDTLQLHAGQGGPDPATGARAVPIYATSSYVFEDADHAAQLFAGLGDGNQYGRMDNPTVQVFVDRIVALEGGKGGVAFSSGQAATTATLLALAEPGKHVVFSREMFGGTYAVARKILEPWGVSWDAVDQTVEAVEAAIRDETVAVWVENIANPTCTVPDIPAIAALCKTRKIPFVVDNTWGCAGYLCRPLEMGANIVVHSATKWIGGHGTFIGGALVDGGTFDWDHPNFPAFSRLDSRGRSYIAREGDLAFRLRAHDLGLFVMGMTLSPQTAFLGLQGLETLSIRVQRECDSALALARWLEAHPAVARVHYPGLESHPSHAVAKRVLRNGFGGVLSFETKDEEGAKHFVNRVKIASHLANIGDARTVVILPWFTTHSALEESVRRSAGITPQLVRLSAGLEDLEDLMADLDQALRR